MCEVSFLIDKTMMVKSLALLLQNEGLRGSNARKLSEQSQYPYRTGVICGVVTPKDSVQNGKTPLQNIFQ